VWQRRVAATQPLTGGWTSTVTRLTAETGEQAVLRLMTKQPWRRHAPGLLARDEAVQKQLEPTAIPAPRSIATDLSGVESGAPAHLMSCLPGRLDYSGKQAIEPLAQLLVEIHHFDPGADRPREYQSWAGPDKWVVPGWAQEPHLWNRAFHELAQPAPGYEGTFLHRDFHLGNVLWTGNRITGVVDWVETSWGPAGLDVAHAATYLAMLHGNEPAARFAEAYFRRVGRPAAEEFRYWNLMDVVGYLPDPAKVVHPWRDAGLEVTDRQAQTRLEQRLKAILEAHE
jgi:aminoglycoside phosphotransferase (APT) family kinase protein